MTLNAFSGIKISLHRSGNSLNYSGGGCFFFYKEKDKQNNACLLGLTTP